MNGEQQCWFLHPVIFLTFVLGVFCQSENEITPCGPERYSKVLFNQTVVGQYVEYDVDMPPLNGFTLHYWINILRPTALASTFSYLALDTEYKDYVQATILSIGAASYAVLQVKGVVVSNTLLPENIVGKWHHILHSWDGETGAWSIYFNGELIEEGVSLRSKGLVVAGGGRAFTGQQANAMVREKGVSCAELGQFKEGVEGWMTLLSLDSRTIVQPKYWMNRMAVAVVASSCHTDHDGDIIGWLDTPRRGYCGVLESRANSVCGDF